jgi:hypothetical protein
MFMHTGSWGVWHDSITADDILNFPVRFPDANDPLVGRIQSAVGQLAGWNGDETPWHILRPMDEAIFDLFELSLDERDLVRGFHTYTLGLVGTWNKAIKSSALDPIRLPKLRRGRADDLLQYVENPLALYLDRFLREWNKELEPDGEFSWHVVSSPRSDIIAAIFETRNRGADLPVPDNEDQWYTLLDRLAVSLRTALTPSVVTEGVLRSVSDTSIIVIKRNETRLWTATAAQEDVGATKLQAMALQDQ